MAREKVSLVLPYDFEDVFTSLTIDEAGRLIRAIYAYERRGEEPDFSDSPFLLFTWKTHVKHVIDRNVKKYQEVCEKRKVAGSKGGKASGESRKTKQNEANEANACFDSDNEANEAIASHINGKVENSQKTKQNEANEAIAYEGDCDCEGDCEKEKDCEYDCDKNHPSNLQTTSCNNIAGLVKKAVDNFAPDKTENAEPDFDKPRSESLGGRNFEKSPEEDEYALSPPDAFKAFREAYPRKQGSLRDVQTAWVNATECGHVLPGDLVYAARNYARTCSGEKTDPRYIKMPQNFISSGLWKQYVPKYLPSCPHCHGQGIYEDSGGMVQCNCDRRYWP